MPRNFFGCKCIMRHYTNFSIWNRTFSFELPRGTSNRLMQRQITTCITTSRRPMMVDRAPESSNCWNIPTKMFARNYCRIFGFKDLQGNTKKVASCSRWFHSTLKDEYSDANQKSMEEEKTKIQIINEQKTDEKIVLPFIYKYSKIGFNIGNNRMIGSVALLPQGVLSWKVVSHHQITPESLSLFAVVHPKLEILVLGVGDKVVQLPRSVWDFARQNGIALEVLDTPNACATFNFLTEEGRRTGAALIPPQSIRM